MFSGPMFRWEFAAATRRRRSFVFRTVFAIALGLMALVAGLVIFRVDSGLSSQNRMILFGRSVFLATIALELLVLMFFVPAHVANAIAEEREKDTMSLLLLTRLMPFEIVSTKAFARWLPATNPILAGAPVLVASGWAAGLEVEAVLAVLVLLCCSAFMASLAILSSAQRENAGAARGQATGWIFGWLIGPPIMSVIPISPGSLWGDLLAEVKSLCRLVAPSSPVSLLTDAGWYYRRPGAFGLYDRIGLMIGLQAAFGLLALALASSRLKAREKNPNWLDPTRGYRPPCGDDPIFWREFDLPMRRGAGPLIFLRLRYVGILIRAILINLFTLLGVLLSLAVPVVLIVSVIYYGSAAFRELWEHGYGPAGSFVDRSNFSFVIRAATGMLVLLPILGMAALVSGRITTERDKKTWDAFLTTPLEGAEILRSKARVALTGLWRSAWPLPILWAAGLACGVNLPLGIALATVDLLLLAWANVALGLYLGIRPITTAAASNRSAMWMLGFLVIQTPLLWAAFVTPRELGVFEGWSLAVRVGVVAALLASVALTGGLAWYWTRRTIGRFDEWVGRPASATGE